MSGKITVLGKDYSRDEATKKMRGHISWLYWIAGLSLANLVYVFLDQGYFMVAGLGLNSYLASQFATSDDQFLSMQQYLGVAFVIYFLVSGYLGFSRNFPVVAAATAVYAFDAVLFATIYFDVMSLLFHVWATVSLVLGMIMMVQLKASESKDQLSEGIT